MSYFYGKSAAGGGGGGFLASVTTGDANLEVNSGEEVGIKFTNSSGVTRTLTSLGTMFRTGAYANYKVALFAADGTTLIEQVTVDITGASNGQMLYEDLATPRDIPNGESRHLRVVIDAAFNTHRRFAVNPTEFALSSGWTYVDYSDEAGTDTDGYGAVVDAAYTE